MDWENVKAPLEKKPVNRFHEITRRIVDLDAASIGKLAIGKFLGNKKELVDRVEGNIRSARERAGRVGAWQEHVDAGDTVQIVKLHARIERRVGAKNIVFRIHRDPVDNSETEPGSLREGARREVDEGQARREDKGRGKS